MVTLASSLQITASLSLVLGLAAVYLTWRRKGARDGLWRHGLPAGWALLALGLGGWATTVSADQGLALAAVLVMVLALAIVAAHGLAQPAKSVKAGRIREDSSRDSLTLGRGYWGRVAVRLTGSLLIVPAFGIAAGLLWYAYVPGDEADRLIGMALISTLAAATALVILLASRRPYRSAAVLTLATLVAAGLVLVPTGIVWP